MMTTWLAEGLKEDAPTLPAVKKAEVFPAARVLKAPAKWQQLGRERHLRRRQRIAT